MVQLAYALNCLGKAVPIGGTLVVILLPRGAEAIARAGLVLCAAVTRHPLVPANDPDPVRQALYAAVVAACAQLKELVPDRFVDPGQSSTDVFVTDAHGVETPTQFRKNGGRLTMRVERLGIVSFASCGLTAFNAVTGAFTDATGTYGTVNDFYNALSSALAGFYGNTTHVTLERIEQTVGGNLTVVTPAGTYPTRTGPGLLTDQPMWVISTITIRTARAGRALRFKMPGAGVALGKQNVSPALGGSALQNIIAILQVDGGGPEAYDGIKPAGLGLVSCADNSREYRRITR